MGRDGRGRKGGGIIHATSKEEQKHTDGFTQSGWVFVVDVTRRGILN